MMISAKIIAMIKVADTLGAPQFSLDDLRRAAEKIEQLRQDRVGETFGSAFDVNTSDLDAHLAIIDAGARQAFSWIVGHQMLPAHIDAQIDRDDDADKPLGQAWRLAKKYI
jgi:hypothetical protein